MTNFKAREFDQLVAPITLHKVMNRDWTSEMLTKLSNVKMLSILIGRCDSGKAVPVLLCHYLSVNGKLVRFNIHPNFSDSLKGLIVVDARKTDAKTLSRFIRADGSAHFTSFHKQQDSAKA